MLLFSVLQCSVAFACHNYQCHKAGVKNVYVGIAPIPPCSTACDTGLLHAPTSFHVVFASCLTLPVMRGTSYDFLTLGYSRKAYLLTNLSPCNCCNAAASADRAQQCQIACVIYHLYQHPGLPIHTCDIVQGKILMLITNSDYHYTNKMMTFAYNRFLPEGSTWRDLFDMVSLA